ncbi:MAG TPA: ATP-binding protein, partial [Steroidobacteraceae bacterium]|nr:ATP-binding protein [Steroidobacteraceae bacterium]
PLSAAWASVLNDAAWTLASIAAALICFNTSRQLPGRERLAWRLIALSCAIWFAGQCVWTYYELAVGQLPQFPHWMQVLFVAYPLLLAAGMIVLPKPAGASGMTVRHSGNLGLIVCAFVSIMVIAITEPAFHTTRSAISIFATILHIVGYAIASITALYLLWSYSWQTAYWPLTLIAIGSAIHTATFVTDVHSRFAGTYALTDAYNVAWIFSFACVACAAYEYLWRTNHAPLTTAATLESRQRALEATMPAFLILAILIVVVLNAESITARVIYLITGAAFAFAVILGVREAWIQREEQRLIGELNASNANLIKANAELNAIEQSHRALNIELERRVAERTQKLSLAYEELENFSYAVAHDLKAPLRAVDGFGALLDEEYGIKLDTQGRNYVARMRRGAVTMATLVDDLLAYARVDRREARVAPLHLKKFVRNCVEEQQEEIERKSIVFNMDVDDVELMLDGEGLGIALRNVLQNAIKFSATVPTPIIALRATQSMGHLTVSIADNGIGFDMQYHDRIFAMFQRLHRSDQYPGTGIGLAIARKAVERAGGSIWAHSEPGAGATFHIKVPVA